MIITLFNLIARSIVYCLDTKLLVTHLLHYKELLGKRQLLISNFSLNTTNNSKGNISLSFRKYISNTQNMKKEFSNILSQS